MPFFTDQLNRTIELPQKPVRIVSLVPSQTELLFSLSLNEEVVGITKFCIHPDNWFRTKQRIGGTKNVDIEKVASLQPDLIIANKEENVQEQIEALAEQFPVWVSDVNNLDDATSMMLSIGEMVQKHNEAKNLVSDLQQAFSSLSASPNTHKTAYLIWRDPYMTVGSDTFIHQMMKAVRFQNVFADKQRYPQISLEQLQAANCQLLLLSSEPYPFKQKHADELQTLLPNTKVLVVDGELFSWYGSRLLHSPPYFIALRKQVEAML